MVNKNKPLDGPKKPNFKGGRKDWKGSIYTREWVVGT